MKVLVYRYNSICEPDIIKAFNELGCSVVEYTKEMTVKNYAPKDAVRELGAFLQDNPCDFVFSVNFFPYVSEVCNLYKLKYLSWIVDSPVMEMYSKSISREYNRVFIFDRTLALEISELNPGRIFHLPLAANTEDKDALFSNTSLKTKEKFTHGISFVGSLYTEKCPYDRVGKLPEETRGFLEGIMAAQEKVYGYYFIEEVLSDKVVSDFKSAYPGFYSLPEGNYLTDKRTLAQMYIGSKITSNERIHSFKALSEAYDVALYTGSDTKILPRIHNMGRAKTLTEMPVIFNRSKVNINISSKMIRSGLPLRIFDILSSGGFVLSNYQEEIPELLVPGEDIVIYQNVEELVYLAGYYLDHENEREEIARSGYEKLKANYTYNMQLEKLIVTGLKS